jgi:hypothetical protein
MDKEKRWVICKSTPELREDLLEIRKLEGLTISDAIRKGVREYRLRLQRAEARRIAQAR